jgi:acetyl esterase/lipase
MMVKEQLITKKKTHALVRYFAVLVLLLTVESLAQNGNAFRNPEINIPPAGDRPDGIIEVDAVFDGYSVNYLKDIVYASYGERDVVVNLLLPSIESAEAFPLIMFVQGSAWLPQNVYRSLPVLVDLARSGYVIASIEYRHSREALAPAQVQDVKAAIRFMRANASRYNINPGKVGVIGSSSGGHLAALVGTSDGEVTFLTQDNSDMSNNVQAVVDFFGPTDFLQMDDYPSQIIHNDAGSPESLVVGGPIQEPEQEAMVNAYNPITYISFEKDIPPFLIIHGDIDALVPFNQSVLLYEALKEANKEATFYRVNGAGHGPGIFSAEIMDIAKEFLDQHLK